MELTISFQETSKDSDKFFFDLILDSQSHQRNNPFTCPMNDRILTDLRWYLEDYLDYPYGPFKRRGERIEAKLDEWGEALFRAIFSQAEARVLYDRLVESAGPERLLTIMSPDPRVLRLPWELMRDQAGPLYSAGISIRRHVQQRLTPTLPSFSLPLKVLYIIARPTDADFIDPRFSAHGVMDALSSLIERGLVEVDFVRPATFEQLSRVLGSERGRYNILHFDGHGFYDDDLGLGGLAFEDVDHKAHLVTADELGDLLNRRGIALAVLGACRTGREVEAMAFSSVAARLIIAGVGSVISMSYSIYIEAARLFMLRFYETLVSGRTIGVAVQAGRESLMTNPRRNPLTSENYTLKDWFLPLLYQRGADSAPLAAVRKPRRGVKPRFRKPAEGEDFGAFPLPPHYGFVGRSKELLQLERVLLNNRVVVMYGFAGVGKTALAREVAYWLAETGMFPGGAVFTTFEHGETDEQAILVVGEYAEGVGFLQRPVEEREAIAEAYLTEHPTLVVWDNFETVFDDHYPVGERDRLLKLATRWANLCSGSRLLITSRGPESNIPGVAKVELGGFADRDALDFAAVILGKEGINRDAIDRDNLQRLLDLLGNHALSLALVLPKLREMTVDQILNEFEELLPGFKIGEGRTESLIVSLEFSLRRLNEETRAMLPDFAIFRGGTLDPAICSVTEIDEENWNKVRDQLVRVGLATWHSAGVFEGREVGFVHFHPALLPYLRNRLNAERRITLEDRFLAFYAEISIGLFDSYVQGLEGARLLARREWPNLLYAWEVALAKNIPDLVNRFSALLSRLLMDMGRWHEREQLLVRIKPTPPTTEVIALGGGFTALVEKGHSLIAAGRLAEAEELYLEILAQLDNLQDPEANQHQIALRRGLAQRGLAQIWKRTRPSDGIAMATQALRTFRELEPHISVARTMQMACLADRGDALLQLEHYHEAKADYEACLAIAECENDRREVAVVNAQLGTLALLQNELAEARMHYKLALTEFELLNELPSVAMLWYQLGIVTEKADDFEEATRCYRRALKLAGEANKPIVAAVSNALGLLAEHSERFDEAEQWYHRAIETNTELGNQGDLCKDYLDLTRLLLRLERLDEAEIYVNRGREIAEGFGLSKQLATAYIFLSQIAEKHGQFEKAAYWRWKTSTTFMTRYSDVEQELEKWRPVIGAVVAACKGSTTAIQWLASVRDQLERQGWSKLARAIRRILDGERGIDLMDDLDILEQAIVMNILSSLRQYNGAILEDPHFLLDLVLVACTGDALAGQLAWEVAEELSSAGQPQESQALGQAIRRILAGDRNQERILGLLAGLSPQLAEAVRQLLVKLEN